MPRGSRSLRAAPRRARACLRGPSALARELLEYHERRAHGERGIAAAAHELQRLRHELDLADAARAELHVVGELAALDVAAHFGMELAHRVERGVVQIFAEDERAHDGRELVMLSARQRPRLDPCVALPFAALGDEVGLEKIEAADERPGIAVGPKAHVDAEYEAVLGGVVEQAHEPPRRRLQPRRALAIRMQENEIDVGGDVELAPAQ